MKPIPHESRASQAAVSLMSVAPVSNPPKAESDCTGRAKGPPLADPWRISNPWLLLSTREKKKVKRTQIPTQLDPLELNAATGNPHAHESGIRLITLATLGQPRDSRARSGARALAK
jgi:hypothetical protein